MQGTPDEAVLKRGLTESYSLPFTSESEAERDAAVQRWIKSFPEQLRRCTTDDDRCQLILRTVCSVQFIHQRQSEVLGNTVQDVIRTLHTECLLFRDKSFMKLLSQDSAIWRTFSDTAERTRANSWAKQYDKMGGYWGAEVVEHYWMIIPGYRWQHLAKTVTSSQAQENIGSNFQQYLLRYNRAVAEYCRDLQNGEVNIQPLSKKHILWIEQWRKGTLSKTKGPHDEAAWGSFDNPKPLKRSEVVDWLRCDEYGMLCSKHFGSRELSEFFKNDETVDATNTNDKASSLNNVPHSSPDQSTPANDGSLVNKVSPPIGRSTRQAASKSDNRVQSSSNPDSAVQGNNANTRKRRSAASVQAPTVSDPVQPSLKRSKRHAIMPKFTQPLRDTQTLHEREQDDVVLLQTVIAEAQMKLDSGIFKIGTWGYQNSEFMASFLSRVALFENDKHLLVVDEQEAEALVESGNAIRCPILTRLTQPVFIWNTKEYNTPMMELFDDLWRDPERMVSVQRGHLKITGDSFESKPIYEVKARFQQPTSDDSWNLLDVKFPCPVNIPMFLRGRNCRALTYMRDIALSNGSAERQKVSSAWKEIETWMLLAQGGAYTLPHMDSHGLSTWISVQQGHLGFAWLANPDKETRQKWMDDTSMEESEIGDWRYVIIRAGQTIFFPTGTVHCVFRENATATLALGGHVLQWSEIRAWIDTMIDQIRFPYSTNEALADAEVYADYMEALLKVPANAKVSDISLKEFRHRKQELFDAIEEQMLGGRRKGSVEL